jgi:class 3 adenylate cyclase/tetratricopeptide (TPR) repeat protein
MDVVTCPNCGEENPAKFRLCGFCGTPLATALPAAELRKTVTIIFSDLKGSTALGERIDPEALHEIKNRYFDAMAEVLAQHGGKIEKYIGDAIMAVFGLPKVREDDALRAVRAAYGMQQALTRINVDLERAYGITLANRTGVNTGEVVATGDTTADQRLADGDAVNVAARLEQAAPAQEILIGDVTYRLVRDFVDVEAVEPLTLKGKAEPVPAYRLLGLRAASTDVFGADGFPLIGRSVEFEALTVAFAEVRRSKGPRLVTLAGDAGVGKSRLIAEFTSHLGDTARRLRGRCLPYGEGITFWPLADVTRAAAAIDDEDSPEVARNKIGVLLPLAMPDRKDVAERIATMVGLSTETFPVTELFWGARKLLEVLAADRPLVLVIDDIHFAEQTFLEFLTHLIDSGQAPILIIASARPDLLERLPDWSAGERASRIILEPLSPADTELVIDRLLGETGLAAGVRERVVSAAEGNPFFIEQMVSMLVERGFVRNEADRWLPTTDLSELTIPPSINALLAARLDDLSREERAVIEPAAVIGLTFPEPALLELVPDPVRPLVDAQLRGLSRKQLVRPAADAGFYRFTNLLIRDAAYQSLLKRARATLHERFAAWAERVNRERGREMEFDEILGYHLEQAFRYRQDLGPIDVEGWAIARRGAAKLGAAGRRAFIRGDLPAASNLLPRAAALLEPDDRDRIDLTVELGEVYTEAGRFSDASTSLAEAIAAAERIGDERLVERARLARLAAAFYAEELPPGGSARAIEEAQRAATMFDRAGDQIGLARALRVIAIVQATSGDLEAAAEATERCVDHASRAGDRRLASRAAAAYATIALAGPIPTREVLERCAALLDQVTGDQRAEATILAVMGVIEAMEGRFDRGRELHARARGILEGLGRSVTAISTSIEAARIELLAGDPAAAEALLRTDDVELEAIGERYFRSTIAALLAQTLVAQERMDEAEAYATLAADLADEDDTTSQALWRIARARIRASQGRPGEALELADAAVALVTGTAAIDLQGDIHTGYSAVLLRQGRVQEAMAHLEAALGFYERKGDVAAAEAVRAQLATVAVG